MTTVAPTTNTEILPLLIRLTELAPELCLHEPIGFNQVHRFRLNGNIAAVIDLKEGGDLDQLDYAILQWVLQGAIRDREWSLESHEFHNKWRQRKAIQRIDFEPATGEVQRMNENAAIALLAAFVSALEGQP